MTSRKWAWLLVCGVGVWGCKPPEIVPVALPGMEYKQIPTVPDDQQAQALGETSSRAGSSSLAQATQATQDSNVAPTSIKAGSGTDLGHGLKMETLKEGNGKVAQMGQYVTVHYVGTLPNGKEFDSSRRKGEPFSFKLGNGEVIQGWDQGVAGMKIGETRRLIVPPDLAYGADGRPPVIPPNSPLHFDVELLDVK